MRVLWQRCLALAHSLRRGIYFCALLQHMQAMRSIARDHCIIFVYTMSLYLNYFEEWQQISQINKMETATKCAA